MRQLSRIVSIIIILGALIVSIIPACAGPHLYAGKRKKINCGVLVVPGAVQPLVEYRRDGTGGVGDLFFLLEIRTDLKPSGWSLENPLSPSGTKNTPVYWQVDLHAARDLSNMHILYLPASGKVTLDRKDREKLRRFVDGGGVLWIDNTTTTGCLDFDNSFFIQDFLFDSGTPGAESPVNRHHPLLSLPYWLNDGEAATLGYYHGQCYCKPGFSSAGPWATRPQSFDTLLPVVSSAVNVDGSSTANWPSLAASVYGSGRIVASANYIGRGCFMSFPYDQSNLKFAYNLMAWASAWTHLRKDPRHSGASIDTVGGTKLVKLWSHLAVPTAGMESSPVIYKNLVFYSSGSKLYALDLMPQEDLDQNGNKDDGLQDMSGSTNEGQDIVWMWPEGATSAPGTLSSPTIVTAQDPKSPDNTIEAVLVMSSNGDVFMLDAFPRDPATNEFKETTTTVLPNNQLSWNIGSAPSPPSPPLYVNGWIYALNEKGHVFAYNPSIEQWNIDKNASEITTWIMPNAYMAGKSASAAKSALSYGLIKNENNDAIVGMLYWATDTLIAPNYAERNDHIFSIPIFVSNDRVKILHTDTTRRKLECKISYNGSITGAFPSPVAWVEGSDGTRYDVTACHPNSELNGDSIQPIVIPPAPALPAKIGYMVVETELAVPTDSYIYATYGLEYASSSSQANLVTQPLQPFANNINNVPPFLISGTPSMSNDNMIFASGTHGDATGDPGGAIYGIRNDSSVNGNLFKWIYYLHAGTEVPSTSGAVRTDPVPIPGVVVTGKLANGYPISLRNIQPYAPPVVVGDKVITAVTGENGQYSAILCFKANPDFVIRITQNAGYGPNGKSLRVPKKLIDPITNRRMQVKVWQPNLLMGYTGDAPSAITAVQVPQEMIDYGRGTITFNEFSRLKLMTTTGMLQTNSFSPSLPVWVFLDNIEVPIDFSTWSPLVNTGLNPPEVGGDSVDLSSWNNLLWYYVVSDGAGISSAPVVIGNTIYFITNDGTLYALNSETGETSAGLSSQKPIWQESISTSGSFSNTTHTSIAGANGVLLIPAPDGLHAYSNATTLVADSDRLLELDGAGEIGWSLDSIEWPVALPSSTTSAPPRRSGPISKPGCAKYAVSGSILLVNTGANQVCMIGRDGFVGLDRRGNPPKYFRWMFDKFADPKGLLRSGQTTTLSGPTDALLWQEIESDGTTNILVIHCMIADSGNNRIIDLVYRINSNGTALLNDTSDPDSGYYLPELNWITKTDTTNERYVFNCIQLVPNSSNNGADVWAAISNYGTGTDFVASPSANEKGLGGAIVALKYRISGGSSATWDYSHNDTVNNLYSGQIVAGCDRVSWGDIKPLACPRFFQILNKSGNRYLLICDNYGVYKAGPINGATPPTVVQSLKDEDYRDCPRQLTNEYDGKIYMTDPDLGTPPNIGLGVPLMATSVQEMPNGNWLIANGYSGTDISGTHPFAGEVFEYDPTVALNALPIKWNTPILKFMDSTVNLIDWSNWRQASENASFVQQPRSALRQF